MDQTWSSLTLCATWVLSIFMIMVRNPFDEGIFYSHSGCPSRYIRNLWPQCYIWHLSWILRFSDLRYFVSRPQSWPQTLRFACRLPCLFKLAIFLPGSAGAHMGKCFLVPWSKIISLKRPQRRPKLSTVQYLFLVVIPIPEFFYSF